MYYLLFSIHPALASQNLSRDFVNLPYLTSVNTASLHNRAGASSQLPFRDRLCPFHFLLSFEIVLSGLDFGPFRSNLRRAPIVEFKVVGGGVPPSTTLLPPPPLSLSLRWALVSRCGSTVRCRESHLVSQIEAQNGEWDGEWGARSLSGSAVRQEGGGGVGR